MATTGKKVVVGLTVLLLGAVAGTVYTWRQSLRVAAERDKALEVRRAARDAEPDNLEVRWALGRSLAAHGLRPEAMEIYQGLLEEEDLDRVGRDMLLRAYDALRRQGQSE